MRQRKVKNEAEKLSFLEEYMVKDGKEHKGKWVEVFPEISSVIPPAITPESCPALYLEIGCGRGHFLATLARQYPDRLYLGAEGRSSIVLRALELIRDQQLPNVLCIPGFIDDPEEYFVEGELSGIYLNFSDPWPKARHAKRRLTYRGYLESYRRILKPGSSLEIKTDNDGLFAFTLEECQAAGFAIAELAEDLHKTDLPSRLITTQYEERYRLLNKKIHYCKVKV